MRAPGCPRRRTIFTGSAIVLHSPAAVQPRPLISVHRSTFGGSERVASVSLLASSGLFSRSSQRTLPCRKIQMSIWAAPTELRLLSG
ncbi:unnamed protein product [Rangifer tarandus platyrhynchus]|uniref:Uncharacterized protein n=1 Tax=Rangifer tarandus platyrhynchus TaxID=3082113 RepID=A0AC59YVY6_RANTA